MSSDESAEAAGSTEDFGPLEVLSPDGSLLGRTTMWFRLEELGQVLIAAPSLRLSQEACIRLSGGHGLSTVFRDCRLKSSTWEADATFVAGLFEMWRTGQPCIRDVGIVLGKSADIGKALQRMKRLLG
jgi:hypothetical protein